MLVSYNWLKQYVDLPDSLTPEELGLKLTMGVVEVEGVKKRGEKLDGVVVGEILEIKKHPNADKLSVAQVDVGEKKPRQIIFGQMVEMEVGFKIPVALAPTTLPGDNKIKEAKLRGVESQGMLCLDQEMGLAEEGVSIRFFDKKIKNGTPIIKALGLDDTIFEIDNKSMTHRPDLWGHYGLAREVAAAYGKKLAPYDPPKIGKREAGSEKRECIDLKVHVEDLQMCPRYMAVAIDGIKVESSPDWMQNRLLAVGLRPINNIVDITNYVLYDLGQPMHAFDASRLGGTGNGERGIKIIIRRAKDGEKFTTLDEQQYELTSDMLVIADEKKAVALAGVMGGMNSEISDNTNTIVYESANFNATNVRHTALQLGLRTDSSTRFEKSLDPNNAQLALRRAVQLTLEICPGAKVVSSVADERDFYLNQGPIDLSLEFLNKKIGKEIEKKEVIKILEGLGFFIVDKKEVLKVTVPTWRATKDISIPEDLVEEVARVYGYGNIETSLPMFSITPPKRNEPRLLERKIKNILAGEYGFTEVMLYSFIAPELIKKTGFDVKKHIELDNPIAKDRPYLRRSLLPNLLEALEKNTHIRDSVYLFEFGKTFIKEELGERVSENSDELLPRQDVMCNIVYSSKVDEVPYYEVVSAVRELLSTLGVGFRLEPAFVTEKYIHPGRAANIVVRGISVGVVGELHPAVQEKMGIDMCVGIAELNLNVLLEYISEKSNYKGISQYPAVLRDIAFVVERDVVHEDVVMTIKKVDELITDVELFDVFVDNKLGKGKKSMAYHITYLSKEKTLEAEGVDIIHKKVGEILTKQFKAEIRN